MVRKPVIRKGFAGVSDSDFIRRKPSGFRGVSGEQGPTPEQRHKLFLEKLNSWLRANCAQLIDTFSRYDGKGCGMVSKEEFGESLLLMKAPLTKEETKMVIEFLTEKPPRDKIDYLLFARGVQIPFPVREDVMNETQDIKLEVRDISHPKCAKCKLKFPPTQRTEVRPRYVELNMELLQFLEKEIPCNFTEKVTASLTVLGIKQLVQHKFGHSLLDLKVYREKTGESEPLKDNLTLSKLGFKGNLPETPETVTLYYDVHVNVHVNIEVTHPFYACPLLLTDHYFAKHNSQNSTGPTSVS
ncbi:hypothetical protein ACHWQZ_G007845 [Mnemiopsis leidyi]